MKEKLTRLLETRKLISFAVIALFIQQAVTGALETNFIQTVIIAIVSFYFGQSTGRDTPKK